MDGITGYKHIKTIKNVEVYACFTHIGWSPEKQNNNHCGWVLTTASPPRLVKLCRQHPVSLSGSAPGYWDISGDPLNI